MKESFRIDVKKITGTAILTAIELVLILISNYVKIGPLNLNLALIPISLAGILFGPLSGLFVGLINGLVTIFAPDTIAVFMPYGAFQTVILCLIKTGLAGFLAGLIFIPFKSKNNKLIILGSVLSAIAVPIINTGIFIGGCFLFFKPLLDKLAEGSDSIFTFVIVGFIGWNFVLELSLSLVLSPAINQVVRVFIKRKELQ